MLVEQIPPTARSIHRSILAGGVIYTTPTNCVLYVTGAYISVVPNGVSLVTLGAISEDIGLVHNILVYQTPAGAVLPFSMHVSGVWRVPPGGSLLLTNVLGVAVTAGFSGFLDGWFH